LETAEQLLVSKIIEEKDLGPVADAGITLDYFLDGKNRRVFDAILQYKQEHGTVPALRRIKQDHPRFPFIVVEEPWSDLISQVRNEYHLALMEEALADAVEIYDKHKDGSDREVGTSLFEIKARLHTVLTEMEKSVPNMKDTNLAETADDRWDRYEALRNRTDELLGIPSGFSRLDQALQGFQAGQLIVFVGPPKAGKSTMMLLAALAAHRLHKVPLLVGFEMSNEEQEQRIDAITAKISHHRLRGGNLTDDERKRLKRQLHTWESMADFMLSNDTMSTTTLSGIESKAEKYDPDILIVDGVYMMQDENGEKPGSPQALTNITRGFKRMCQNKSFPTIITTQVLEWKMDKKAGVTANSVGYSSSFQQDADALVAVENTEDEKVKKIKILLARNHPPCEFFVRWDWETGEFEELPDDYFEALEDDGEDDYGDRY
jgi:replicative DNA helicase